MQETLFPHRFREHLHIYSNYVLAMDVYANAPLTATGMELLLAALNLQLRPLFQPDPSTGFPTILIPPKRSFRLGELDTGNVAWGAIIDEASSQQSSHILFASTRPLVELSQRILVLIGRQVDEHELRRLSDAAASLSSM